MAGMEARPERRVRGTEAAGDAPCGHGGSCPLTVNDRRTGFVDVNDTLGGTETHRRPSYCDRLPGGRHPTAVDADEQTRPWQRADALPRPWRLPSQGGGSRVPRPRASTPASEAPPAAVMAHAMTPRQIPTARGTRPFSRTLADAIGDWFARRPRLSAILAGNHGLL